MKKIMATIKSGIGSLFKTAMGGDWANKIFHNAGEFSTKKFFYVMTQIPAIVTAWICCAALSVLVWKFLFESVAFDTGAFATLATAVFLFAGKNAIQYLQGKKIDNGNRA